MRLSRRASAELFFALVPAASALDAYGLGFTPPAFPLPFALASFWVWVWLPLWVCFAAHALYSARPLATFPLFAASRSGTGDNGPLDLADGSSLDLGDHSSEEEDSAVLSVCSRTSEAYSS